MGTRNTWIMAVCQDGDREGKEVGATWAGKTERETEKRTEINRVLPDG